VTSPAEHCIHPDPETYRQLSAGWPLVPMWTELVADVSTPVGVLPSLAGSGPGVLLESVERSERWGRYSFVGGDPAAIVTVDGGGVRTEPLAREPAVTLPEPAARSTAGPGPLAELDALAGSLRSARLPELPPFAGGLVGVLAYEAASLLDGSPHPGGDELPCPAMRFLLIDRAVVFDHWRQRILLIAHVPRRAGYRSGMVALEELADRVRWAEPPPVETLREEPLPASASLNVRDQDFLAGVRRAKEHILAGDIFQAVLSRRISVPASRGALPIYRRLRVTNPSPYMFLIRLPGVELAGSSPEPLVRVEGRRVITRPLAGTRPRSADPQEDLRLEEELLADPKERAEHAMLVDLARNDLGRVCRAGSVSVTELMRVERWSRVMHLVSTVSGDLRDGVSALDALAATFPAGTVTGAPKRRAMEIIAEEEITARGPYAGAAGYLSFAGDLDFCITIRTAVVQDGVAHVQAGAGIVADSEPEAELRETEAKASAVLRAVAGGSS